VLDGPWLFERCDVRSAGGRALILGAHYPGIVEGFDCGRHTADLEERWRRLGMEVAPEESESTSWDPGLDAETDAALELPPPRLCDDPACTDPHCRAADAATAARLAPPAAEVLSASERRSGGRAAARRSAGRRRAAGLRGAGRGRVGAPRVGRSAGRELRGRVRARAVA